MRIDTVLPIWLCKFFCITEFLQLGLMYSTLITSGCFTVKPCEANPLDLAGHSYLWDRADLGTTFVSLKSVYLYASDTSRNPLQSCLVFHSILDLLLKISFSANFFSSYYIILLSLVNNSI